MSDQLDWSFLQCFGERTPGEDIQEADIISAVEFDYDGQHLATGDRGGRVVLFERVHPNVRMMGPDQRPPPPLPRGAAHEYRYMTEFQSHEPEFDYLKSLEIEEKIDKVRWCRSSNNARMLLSTNDKTVKLWKVYDKKVSNLTNFNLDGARNGGMGGGSTPAVRSPLWSNPRVANLRMPQVASTEILLAARCKKVYSNAHTYHINSISVNSDQETFLSADDLRINLWNLEITDQSFNIVDIKPANMEDLTEVITSAEFHPRHCNIFAYSSSKGCIRLADMRNAALCDQHAKAFEEVESQANKSFFSEIIASISDITFSKDGRYILSRDYMTVKLWDLHKENAPVATFHTHEHLRSRLCDLYENDSIFDKFDCCINGKGDAICTGSYNNMFKVFGVNNGVDLTLEASRDPMRKRLQTPSKTNRFAIRNKASGKRTPVDHAELGTDYASKLLHLAWHPEADVIAAAASNSLYMYCK
ncbi:PP2A-twin subunit [Dunaliella salina]|uniref:Serine/threonine-protein phosphatase 2A 55 kDa regulatory subunit B n=1 Tax=Dunaliella salina TaxID=3046 RepID=A0ABQ7H4V0_DUNSA|nr:PP2A-twin subunit [Dunaliella salina]|eukprot:KAF5841886.1 PP2A-twin subunit [Dunaliella salina]